MQSDSASNEYRRKEQQQGTAAASTDEDQITAGKHHARKTSRSPHQIRQKTRSVQLEEDCSSREEEHENIVAGPIDLTKPGQVTGHHNRMKLDISEEKDVLGRNRYIEKQRSSQTFKSICDPVKLGRILTEMANGPTQETVCGLQMPTEDYRASVVTYKHKYLWQIEDFSPPSDAELWKLMSGHTMEYSQAVQTRDNAISTGKELKRNFLMGKRARANYSALDHIRPQGGVWKLRREANRPLGTRDSSATGHCVVPARGGFTTL